MKQDSITIGTQKNGGRRAIVQIELPETDAEIASVVKSEAARVRLVQRALRIEMQERSGARAEIEEAPAADFEVVTVDDKKYTQAKKDSETAKKLAKLVKDYDPSAEPVRTGRPSKPREVAVDQNALKAAMKDPQKLAALFAAQGITLKLG